MIGLRTGVVGYLTDRTSCTSGEVAIPDGRVAGEIEVAFRVARPIASDARDDEVIAAIGAVAPAIEVVVFAEIDIEDMLSRDVWHHAYVLGPDTAWDQAVIDELTVTAHHNDEALDVPRPAGEKLAFIPDMLRFVASGAEAAGARLDAGDIVLAGSLAGSLAWLARGDTLTAHMDPLGDVAVRLV
jgi:2-keto-4-pentenoate hydratase